MTDWRDESNKRLEERLEEIDKMFIERKKRNEDIIKKYDRLINKCELMEKEITGVLISGAIVLVSVLLFFLGLIIF